MSDDYGAKSGSLSVELISIKLEIDDDDEDVIEVIVALTNESAIPVGGINATIMSGKSKVEPKEGVSSIGPGLTRNFEFQFHPSRSDWSCVFEAQNNTMELGPYAPEFEYQQPKGRSLGNAIGSSLFSGAFDANLDDFGNINMPFLA